MPLAYSLAATPWWFCSVGLPGSPCAQRDQRKVAAGSLCKAAAYQHGAVLLRKLLRNGSDDIRGVVHHTVLILVQLTDDILHGGVALHEVQHFKAGGHEGVFPAGIDKGRGVACVQGIGDVGIVGAVCLCTLEGQQAAFQRRCGLQSAGACNGGKHTHHLERIFQLLGVLFQSFYSDRRSGSHSAQKRSGCRPRKDRASGRIYRRCRLPPQCRWCFRSKNRVFPSASPLQGHIVVKSIAGVVQHPDVLPLLTYAIACIMPGCC